MIDSIRILTGTKQRVVEVSEVSICFPQPPPQAGGQGRKCFGGRVCLGREVGGRGGGLKGGFSGGCPRRAECAEIIWGSTSKPGGIWGGAGLPPGPPCAFRPAGGARTLVSSWRGGVVDASLAAAWFRAGAGVFIYWGFGSSLFLPLLFSICRSVPVGRLPPVRNLADRYSEPTTTD